MINKTLLFKAVLSVVLLSQLIACHAGDKQVFFKGKEDALERAINNDDFEAVEQAIKQGANPNAVGKYGVTPIIVTSGNLKFSAMKALLKHNANPNTYDKNGDNAVTLAAQTYITGDKRYLELLLDNGGDPNSRLPDNDPLMRRIGLMRDPSTIRYLVNKGAEVNARTRINEPLVKSYAGGAWNLVWVLIELGAKYDYTHPNDAIPIRFRDTVRTPPGSPQFDAKEKVWRTLCESGMDVPPLTTKETWDWMDQWYYNEEPRPEGEMPLISCDYKNKAVIGKWEGKKPPVISAYDKLKERGEL